MTKLSGNESICKGRRVLDFWSWALSDLNMNTNRGMFAEYLVALALGIDRKGINSGWNSYDLLYLEKYRIEVKCTSPKQVWGGNHIKHPVFALKPTRYWDPVSNKTNPEPSWNADVYVLSYFEDDRKEPDSLDLSKWSFYVGSKEKLSNLMAGRKSIQVKRLEKEYAENGFVKVGFDGLKTAVDSFIR